MSDAPVTRLIPNRIIEDYAAVPPLSRSSYFDEHYRGLKISVNGRVTDLNDYVNSRDVAVGIESSPDGARVLALFAKPLPPEVHRPPIRTTCPQAGFVVFLPLWLKYSQVPEPLESGRDRTLASYPRVSH